MKGYTPNVVNGSLLIGGAQTQNNDAGVTMGTVSAANQVQLLVESFGSRKKQKVMASRAANKVNIHSVVGSGDVMMKSVTKQEGISAENKKKIEEGGGTKVRDFLFCHAWCQTSLQPYYLTFALFLSPS